MSRPSPRFSLTFLWPGLPELWVLGQWRGLWPALAFTVWLNAVLVCRFCYSEWIDPWALRVVGMGLTAWWLLAAYRAHGRWPQWQNPRGSSGESDLFAEAQATYLRGEWLECEQLLRRCLQVDARDAPALLLLAAVHRHTGRLNAARQVLDRLNQLESGDAWWLETQRERARLGTRPPS
jgi:hypothetical protein